MRRLRKQDVAVLTRMRELLQRGWTWGVEARTEMQQKTGPLDQDAARFCLMGAYRRARHDLGLSPYQQETIVLMELAEGVRHQLGDDRLGLSDLSHNTIAGFNDRQQNKKPVLALIDRVLSRTRK